MENVPVVAIIGIVVSILMNIIGLVLLPSIVYILKLEKKFVEERLKEGEDRFTRLESEMQKFEKAMEGVKSNYVDRFESLKDYISSELSPLKVNIATLTERSNNYNKGE